MSSEFDKHMKKSGVHISWNVNITIKMKTIVQKLWMIKTLQGVRERCNKWILLSMARKNSYD